LLKHYLRHCNIPLSKVAQVNVLRDMTSKIIIRHDELVNVADVQKQLQDWCTVVEAEQEITYLPPPGKVLDVLALLRESKIAYTAKFNSTNA
jgi:hypothetical protein